MVLKFVERDPAYRELLDHCVDEVLAQSEPRLPGIGERAGVRLHLVAGAVTPYHIDPEHNFLLQIRGWKTMNVFPEADRSLISEQELESFYSGAHRNLVFQERYQDKAELFRLDPGDGLHVPVTAPHWVQNGDQVSVSWSITFRSALSARRETVYKVNHRLRALRLSPAPSARIRRSTPRSSSPSAPRSGSSTRSAGEARRSRERGGVPSVRVSRVRLFLVRHGQVSSNRDLRYVGSRDEPLTELGRKQAAALGRADGAAADRRGPLEPAVARLRHRVRDRRGDRPHRPASRNGCASSRTGRGKDFRATRCARDPPTTGTCSRRGSSTLRSRRPAASRCQSVERRALDLVTDLRAAATDDAMPWIVLVSHVGPIKALLAASLDLPLDRGGRRIFLDPGTVSVVDWGDPPILRLCNSHAHAGWTSARWMETAAR